MKKSLFVLLLMVISIPSFSQYNSGGFTLDSQNLYYGVRIGMTSATIGGDRDLGAKTGMTLAGVVGARVSRNNPLFIESGLYYTERGGKNSAETVSLNYLEVPFLIKYGFAAADGVAILPFFGPYFSYALGGKIKTDAGSRSSFNNEVGYKHGDMGFKLGCGVEYNKLYLELAYQFGVADISSVNNISAHGNAFVANFGVNF